MFCHPSFPSFHPSFLPSFFFFFAPLLALGWAVRHLHAAPEIRSFVLPSATQGPPRSLLQGLLVLLQNLPCALFGGCLRDVLRRGNWQDVQDIDVAVVPAAVVRRDEEEKIEEEEETDGDDKGMGYK